MGADPKLREDQIKTDKEEFKQDRCPCKKQMDLDVGIRIEIKEAKTLHISSESKAE
jgi:hypothetical protein